MLSSFDDADRLETLLTPSIVCMLIRASCEAPTNNPWITNRKHLSPECPSSLNDCFAYVTPKVGLCL